MVLIVFPFVIHVGQDLLRDHECHFIHKCLEFDRMGAREIVGSSRKIPPNDGVEEKMSRLTFA